MRLVERRAEGRLPRRQPVVIAEKASPWAGDSQDEPCRLRYGIAAPEDGPG